MLHQRSTPAVAGAYAIGAISGACVTGFALLLVSGLLSPVPSVVRSIVAIVFLTALLMRAAGTVRFALPQRTYQIPRETFHMSPARAAFRFAFELGTGVRTYVTSSAPYGALVVAALCLPNTTALALACIAALAVGFGLGRSFVVAGQAWRRRIAVDAPSLWLRAAEALSLVCAAAIALRVLA